MGNFKTAATLTAMLVLGLAGCTTAPSSTERRASFRELFEKLWAQNVV